MPAQFRKSIAAVAAIALSFLACSDEDTITSGGGASFTDDTVPFLTIGGGADEQGYAARRTPDGGYLIVGTIGKPIQFYTDLHAVRTDHSGAILGQYPVRRGETYATMQASVLSDDGGIVAISRRDAEAILIKFASDGSVAWERNYGAHPGTTIYSLCTAGDGYLITILPDAFAELNTLEFIFTNVDGTLRSKDEWVSSPLRMYSSCETRDGSFVLAGSQWTTSSNLDIVVTRTKPGVIDEDWTQTIGGQDDDYAVRVVALDNDVVLFGILDDRGYPERGDYFLMRLRSSGGQMWTRNINEIGYVNDMTAVGGDLFLAGRSPVDGPIITHVRGTGSVVWESPVGGESSQVSLLSIAADAGGFVITGVTRTEENADNDILLARLNRYGHGYAFPPHERECMDPVSPPIPSNVFGTQRTYSVVYNTGLGMEAIWAHSSDFVVAVGDSGYIACFDGNSWSQMNSNTNEELYDVFGFAEDDVFVAARHGKIFHYDGASWEEMPSTATYLGALWGSSPDDVWAGGVQLMRYDGATWTDRTPKGWSTPIDMDGITATDIYSVGAGGNVQHFDGCDWTTVYEAPDRLLGVSAIPGPLVYAVGDNGLIVRYTPEGWGTIDYPWGEDFTTVWARSKNDIFIGGTSGFAGPYVLYWINGTSWAKQPSPTSQALWDITGTSDGYLFGTATYGYIVQGTP
jgi:hypothetical protein